MANWLSYLSLGLTIPVLARVVSTIVNPDGSDAVSSRSSIIGGDIESLDKILTFLFCGALGALSDVLGRKPLMAYSALGFAFTCFFQASSKKSLSLLYLADFVDGASSCMSNVCQAYVADASSPERRAVNIGIFQGVSVAGAFILGFPLSAFLAAQYGLRAPMYAAALVSALNAVLIATVVPESLPKSQRRAAVDWKEANPVGALKLLFGKGALLRGACTAYCLVWLGNACINSIFGNYVNHLFGWGPQETAPLLVLVGLMIAIAPATLVPRLGLTRSVQAGALIYGVGLLGVAFAATPKVLVLSTLFSSLGCIAIPALIALIASQAAPNQRGALLGGIETLNELCLALAHSGYGRTLALFISDKAPFKLPGVPFLVASALLFGGFGVATHTFSAFPGVAA